MIQENVLPHLFYGKTKTLSLIVGGLSMMPVNKSRLTLLHPVKLAQKKYLSSQRGSSELVRSMMGGRAFSNDNHLRTQGEERHDRKKDWDALYETNLKGLVWDLKGTNKRLIICIKSTGAWLSICGTIFSGTVLSATEFWYFLCARYNVSPHEPIEPLRWMWHSVWGDTRT